MDNQIKNYFRNRQFANLEYLSNDTSWSADSNNIGLYFFLLDLKGEDTSELFKKILDIKGSYAAANGYLGDIARELFVQWHERQIPIYYFKESLKHDDTDPHVLWNLFYLTHDTSYFLPAIKINYEVKDFTRISSHFFYTPPLCLIDVKFDKKDWLELKDICLDKDVNDRYKLILICCFYLGEFEDGIQIMDENESISKYITDLYFKAGIIDFEYAVQKCSYEGRIKYLEDNPNRIYEEAKKEANNRSVNPTKEALIKHAFEAKEYGDVISLIAEYSQTKKDIDSQLKLYHILSSLFLGVAVNKQYEIAINKINFFRVSGCNPLYLAYLILRNIQGLEDLLVEKKDLEEIEFWGLYQEAEEYLNHDDLLNHYIHDFLVEMLNALKNKWNQHIVNVERERLQCNGGVLSAEDQTRLAYWFIDASRHDEAMLILKELEPSMSCCYLLGVCYEKLGKIEDALKYYELSVNTMKSNKVFDDKILSNYLSCLSQSSSTISAALIDKYTDMFNEGITNYLKSNYFKFQSGKSLFKYYPFNSFTLDALVNEYFYLASSEQLNDPIELPYENLRDDKTDVFFSPNFRLASFSSNENSMLMWSHYAENHTGMMVEYCFDSELPDGVGIESVKYSNTTKRYKEKDRYLFNQYMLTKNKDWAYEREVRLFAYNRDKVYYKHSSYPNRINDKAKAYIKSITVGYKFPESTIKLIQTIIADLNKERSINLSKIELRKAELSENNFFELEYKVIN